MMSEDVMSENEVVEEKRSYCVVRDDLALTRTAYLAIAATGYAQLSLLCVEQPHLLNGYDRDMQPKLALRAKNPLLLEKAAEALRASQIPFVAVEHEGQPAGLFVSPQARSLLPREVANLQLFAERRNPVDEAETPVQTAHGRDAGVIAFRAGLEAPLGKMMAQVGHSAWGAAADMRIERDTPLAVAGLSEQDFSSSTASGGWDIIIDAGRTVFGEPTTTCGYGGICARPMDARVMELGVSIDLPAPPLAPAP